MEISMVTFPKNPKAKITKVKLAEMDVRELEKYLCDIGMTNSVAEQSAGVLFKSFNREVNEQGDLVNRLQCLIDTIKH